MGYQLEALHMVSLALSIFGLQNSFSTANRLLVIGSSPQDIFPMIKT